MGEERLTRRPKWHLSEGTLQQNKTHQQQQAVWTTGAFLTSHLSKQVSHAVWRPSFFFKDTVHFVQIHPTFIFTNGGGVNTGLELITY